MRKKLAFVGAPILTDATFPSDTIAFFPPIRMTPTEGFREISRNENGVTFAMEFLAESFDEWAKRATILYNVGVR